MQTATAEQVTEALVHLRSNGLSRDLPLTSGMTAGDALREAGVRRGFLGKILVGSEVVNADHILKEGDTVTVSPKVSNG